MLRFKEAYKPILLNEMAQLPDKNKELYGVVKELADWVEWEFGKDVVITQIWRSQSQQDILYKDNAKYKKKKFRSFHQIWAAIDLRSSLYTKKEIKLIIEYLEEVYQDAQVYKVLYHKVGKNGGYHFHIELIA